MVTLAKKNTVQEKMTMCKKIASCLIKIVQSFIFLLQGLFLDIWRSIKDLKVFITEYLPDARTIIS